MDPVDEITLTGLRVFGRHGVYAHERADGQEFVVDLTLHLPTAAAAASDDVVDTVHYGELAERVAEVVGGAPVALLETLAQRIADVVLDDDRVERVSITVHKPEAPIAVAFDDVSVTIHRARPRRTAALGFAAGSA
jgi:7,8-dihydroneopterin aldolase/epimerase/oxygenase